MPEPRAPVFMRIVLTWRGGTREEFRPDPDGILWHYETLNGRRWIGWRALLDKIERHMEEARGDA